VAEKHKALVLLATLWLKLLASVIAARPTSGHTSGGPLRAPLPRPDRPTWTAPGPCARRLGMEGFSRYDGLVSTC